MAEALSLLCLVATLAFAVVRPRGLPEIVFAAPAALLLLATGVVSLGQARDEFGDVGATVAFLAAVLVLGDLSAGPASSRPPASGWPRGRAAAPRPCSVSWSCSARW